MNIKRQYMETLHARLLEVLVAFDRFCRQHGLIYWLDYGTLLGAVREKGFIPWDEDVDIAMPVPHFAKLVALSEQGNLPPNLMMWIPPRERRHFKKQGACVKIVDKNSRYHHYKRKKTAWYCPGVFLDVFAVYTLPRPKCAALRNAAAYFACNWWKRPARLDERLFKSLMNRRLKAGELATAMFKRMSVDLEQADYLLHCAYQHAWRKDEVFPLCEKEFAGRKFPVQKNFHQYLSGFYGDYMSLPPAEEREPVILRFFDIQPSGKEKIRVYTSGIFDLFHVGHLRALRSARAHAERTGADVHLIVGVGSDQNAGEYKRKPIIPFAQRMELIAGVDGVDEVIEAPNYPDADFYKKHRIDIHCQGEDNAGMDFYETAKQLGIMRFVGRHEMFSATDIIGEVVRRGG